MAPADGETANLYGKLLYLSLGRHLLLPVSEPISAPAHLDLAEAAFSGNAKVYLRNA